MEGSGSIVMWFWKILILYWAMRDDPPQYSAEQLDAELYWAVQDCLQAGPKEVKHEEDTHNPAV